VIFAVVRQVLSQLILEAPASSRWRLARAGELIRANTKRTLTDGQALSRLRRALLRWAAKRGRHDLPWRQSRDAYRVWISEIMLQQTTVVAVIPYFERFLARFPTLAALAEADEHEVLRLWAGLGYYSRARNLHVAARQVVQDHAGTVPSDVATLTTLPGIGRYTAGAIASFAYDRRAPIVEANTQRVYARLMALREPLESTTARNAIWSLAERAVPAKSPGAFNEALMDLGATTCVPTTPRCDECPVTSSCQAFRDGLQNEIPTPRVRPEPTAVRQAMIAVQRGRRYLLRKSPAGERWAGLWEFLRVPVDRDGESVSLPSIERAVATLCGLAVEANSDGFELRHTVTRFRIRLHCTTARYVSGTTNGPAEYRWAQVDEFGSFAFSMPARRFADRLAN
jgi:A/G-specific adenine glycosylase